MVENSPQKQRFITLCIITAFCCFLLFARDVQALVYCVGCNAATAATCSGADPDNPAADGCDTSNDCIAGDNGVVCPTIAAAIDCIEANMDPNATIRIAQAVAAYPGPGSATKVDNTAGAAQTINILGGWTATTCVTQTLDPANTTVEAPMNDRVFLVDNMQTDSLNVMLEGITITGGNPSGSDCAGVGTNDGGGVCVTSAGSGGVMFTGSSNIYDDNDADAGGGIAVIAQAGGGDVNASFGQDTITFNQALVGEGGGIVINAGTGKTVNASVSQTELGNNTASEFGGGIALSGDGTINLDPVVNSVVHNNIALGADGGGGVAAITSAASSNYSIKFVNNTICDNMAAGGVTALGGGVLVDNFAGSTVNWTLPNDIIYFNTSSGDGDQVALEATGGNATIAIRFSDISQGVGNTDIVGFGAGVGFVNLVDPNFDVDPLFVDRFNGDYHLQPTSEIGDAGTKTAIATVAGTEATPPDVDKDNLPRDISIGAYEPLPSPSPTPTPTPAVTPTPTPIPCTTNDECPDGDICGDMDVCTPGCTEDHPCPPEEVCEDIDQDTGIGMCVIATPTPSPNPTPTPTPTPTPPPIPTPTPTPANIVTFPNAKNGKLVTIESEEGTVLSDVKPLSKNLKGCPEGFDGQFLSFPEGSYQYVVSGINPGDETTVLIDLPPGTVLNSYFKFGPTPDNPQPHCYEFLFDGQTGAQISATTVVVHHVDGARGDDDLTANGVIVDPAAPALLSEEPSNVSGNGCSIAQSVSSRTALLNLLIPLLPAFVVGLRSLRRKKNK